MPVPIETERLRLSAFTIRDTAFVIHLLNSPGWLQFIGDRKVNDRASAETYLTNGPMQSYEMNGFGLMKVELKDSSLPIGMCGLLKRAYLDAPDLGFAFLPEHQGKGYAMESAQGIVDYASGELGLSTLLAIVMPANGKSITLLEKLGFRYKHIVEVPPDGEKLRLYERNHEPYIFSAR